MGRAEAGKRHAGAKPGHIGVQEIVDLETPVPVLGNAEQIFLGDIISVNGRSVLENVTRRQEAITATAQAEQLADPNWGIF